MSSFSCQFIDKNETFCVRLKTDCVPGRPGCILKGKFVFAVPADKRIEEKLKTKSASENKNKTKK